MSLWSSWVSDVAPRSQKSDLTCLDSQNLKSATVLLCLSQFDQLPCTHHVSVICLLVKAQLDHLLWLLFWHVYLYLTRSTIKKQTRMNLLSERQRWVFNQMRWKSLHPSIWVETHLVPNTFKYVTITLGAAAHWMRMKCSLSASRSDPSDGSVFKGDRSWAQGCLSLHHQEDGSCWHPPPTSQCSLCPAQLSVLCAQCWGTDREEEVVAGWVTQQMLNWCPPFNSIQFNSIQFYLYSP